MRETGLSRGAEGTGTWEEERFEEDATVESWEETKLEVIYLFYLFTYSQFEI